MSRSTPPSMPPAIPKGLMLSYKRLPSRGPLFDKVVARAPEPIEFAPTGLTFLVGANGQGKTTLMRYLGGLSKWQPLPQGSARGLYIPDEMQFPPTLSLQRLADALFGKKTEAYQEALSMAEDLSLDPRKPFGTLSQGNRQKVKLIVGMVEAERDRVPLLCLDEPLSGLDYKVRRNLWKQFARCRARRHLLISIHTDKILEAPDKIIAVRRGLITEHAPVSTWEEIEAILEDTTAKS